MHVLVQVSFNDAASTPRQILFAQTNSLAQVWQALGTVQLRQQDGQQLQHVFRLAGQGCLKILLRITFSGLLLGHSAGTPTHLACCAVGWQYDKTMACA